MKILKEEKVLDHGYVQLLDHMGTDIDIVESARISTNSKSKGLDNDTSLINYLMKHRHTSPFEMVEFKFRVRMPIFVARQWVRHRMASINEISGRYAELKTEFYLPDIDRIKAKGLINKQGSEGEINENDKKDWIKNLIEEYNYDKVFYELGNSYDVANELSRINLPLSTYTEIIWKIDLHNLFNFLKLRLANNAQYEIRVYAEAIARMIKDIVPISFDAWEKYILNSITLSSREANMLKAYMHLLESNQCANCGGKGAVVNPSEYFGEKELEYINKFLNKII